MVKIPKRASERIAAGLKQFQPILKAARDRDINESDTAVLVLDLLQHILGYDKYSEITSEHAIRSTYCDLAIKLDGELEFLIEVKAIGIALKDQHVKQAVDYAANQGCDWVILTNGIEWRAYKVTFTKPIANELVVQLDMLQLNSRSTTDVALIGLLAKEGWQKANLGEYHSQKQALSRYTMAALILSEPILAILRREIRRVSPDVQVTPEEIKAVLEAEVVKREILEGEKADLARRRVARTANRPLRASSDDKPVAKA